ncbi:hypothetical protein BT93_E0283 [Corymbia citriodora subsp. variegata]|nr:hypothetical protein BT93_E0283 [Corymbia citriodora subsp. variegata]
MVARLTPDQKVACSIHVGFKSPETVGYPQRINFYFSFFFPNAFSHFFTYIEFSAGVALGSSLMGCKRWVPPQSKLKLPIMQLLSNMLIAIGVAIFGEFEFCRDVAVLLFWTSLLLR